MDFQFSEEHQAVADLADQVMREHGAADRLTAVEATGELDGDLWRALSDTGLLGVALPEAHGGGGLGVLAVHLLAEAAGRHMAHIPLVEHLVAALCLADAGVDADLAARAASGEVVLGLALQEALSPVALPSTVARSHGDDVRLTGTKVMAAWAHAAEALVVTAGEGEHGEPALFLVSAGDATIQPHHLTSTVPHAQVVLEDAPARRVGDAAMVALIVERAIAGLAALQAGMLDTAVRLSATYTSEREQFGRPIATFQAVSQRVASAFIDAECARLTSLEASWRLHEGLEASDQVAIAKWWAAEAGHRVLHAAQHVHGGVGVDREYPLHRYLLRTKQVEFALGSGADHLGTLGRRLAATA
jgi:3-oxocholest-4-en-26-oyl-CoA dehydrogenase beta subunit